MRRILSLAVLTLAVITSGAKADEFLDIGSYPAPVQQTESQAEQKDAIAKAYEEGLKKGIKIGIQFSHQKIKQDFLQFRDLVNQVFNYKYYFLKGEIPSPLVTEEYKEVKGKDNIAHLVKEIKILPPAYFPINLFRQLNSELTGDIITVPAGYIVYVDTPNLSERDIAFYQYLARTDGYYPVYISRQDRLIFGSFQRKADAISASKELKRIGIPSVKVAELEEPLKVEVPKGDERLTQAFLKNVRLILQKEKEVAGVNPAYFKTGVANVIQYLQKALAAAQALDPKRYGLLNIPLLESDIQRVLNNLELALSEAREYKSIFTYAPKVVVTEPDSMKKAFGYGAKAEKPLKPIHTDPSTSAIFEKIEKAKQLLKEGE